MKVYSLIKQGKETGEVFLHLDSKEETRQFAQFLKDFLAENPRRRKVKEWLKEIQKDLPV